MQANQEGYTLLELLIGITLLGMLMAALVVGIHVGGKAWQQGEARLRQVHTEGERAQFMARQISSLLPYKIMSADPELPGGITILEATAARLRFLSSFASHFRSRSGLTLDEYAIVRGSAGNLSLALRETPLRDDASLLRQLIAGVARDPDTGKTIIKFRPFFIQDSDLRLMTGLQMARFDYLDPQAQGKGSMWISDWQGTPEAPYPEAIRFMWQRAGQRDQAVIPIRAHFLPK